jgi:hypothetical protein
VGWRHHLFKDRSRVDVSGCRDGFILTPNCGLALRKTYDDGLDKSGYYQGCKFYIVQIGVRFPQ